MIAIVDYGMGNLWSIKRKLDQIGVDSVISDSPATIKKCRKIILPGVGHFGKAMDEIKKRGLYDALNEAVLVDKTPILGICLGLQLFAGHSEEGDADGMGWIDATVIRFRIIDKIRNKVPHTGWNSVILKKESPLYENIEFRTGFYFVHAYHIVCNRSEDILSITNYELDFVSSVQRDNIYGVQFHPEKSHAEGRIVLQNFVNL
jgi:imidazole glycerol-phosphate synthase subunit HisH